MTKEISISGNRQKEPRKIRYVAIAESSARSCRKIKLLLKQASCYCLVECFKTTGELELKEDFYLPDIVIIEVSTWVSLIPLNKKIQKLQEVIPGIRTVVYYNMMIRYPFFEKRKSRYTVLYASESEAAQLSNIEVELQRD